MRSHYATNRRRNCKRAAKEFANMRAAKERKRIERINAPVESVDCRHVRVPRLRAAFTVTIRCNEDGESATLSVYRGPFGVMPGATLVGRKVACVLANYAPIQRSRSSAIASCK